ncbi:hypothetical protein P4O66_006652, partial [Electrophorus voltai]
TTRVYLNHGEGAKSMAQASVLNEFHEEDLGDVVVIGTSVDAFPRGWLRGRLRRTGQQVAVKLLDCTPTERERLRRLGSAVVSSRLCSERVLLPLGVYTARSLIGLVWAWMAEGSLHSVLYEIHLYPDLPVQLRLRLLLDVAEGLSHLHAVPLLHGALKATSVLLDPEYRAKLCDWGQQTDLGVRAPVCNGGVPCFRDLAYLSPEVIQGGMSSVKADMYSFGILIWEVLNRRRPCEGLEQLQTLLLSAQGGPETQVQVQLLPLETPQSHVLTQLMISCWSSEPEQRPQAEECAAVLRKVMAAFEVDAFTTAVQQLNASKERALLACKHSPTFVPIELNNLECSGGCAGSKILASKVIPMNVPCPHVPKAERVLRRSPPLPAQTPPPDACCRDAVDQTVASQGNRPAGSMQCGGVWGVTQSWTQNPPNTQCVCPTTLIQTPVQQAMCPVSGWSCCRLLMMHRESIVHCMTEGRLNKLLDVLRARRAVTREDYEVITAALTLTARTRCLLDTCACLGENVASLVATTLGLVSTETARAHRGAGMALKWQVG